MARPKGCCCIDTGDGRLEMKVIHYTCWYLIDAIKKEDKLLIYNELIAGANAWYYAIQAFKIHPEWRFQSSLKRFKRIYIQLMEQAVNFLCGNGAWKKSRGFFLVTTEPYLKV